MDTLGEVNPIMYRGYVFYEKTGDWRLTSHYFNSKMEWWINADNIFACCFKKTSKQG